MAWAAPCPWPPLAWNAIWWWATPVRAFTGEPDPCTISPSMTTDTTLMGQSHSMEVMQIIPCPIWGGQGKSQSNFTTNQECFVTKWVTIFRSIHSKFSTNPVMSSSSRRNPYDYLPDEPGAPNPTNKDIMQNSMVNENGQSRIIAGDKDITILNASFNHLKLIWFLISGQSVKPGSRYSSDPYGPTDVKLSDTYDTSTGIYGSTRGSQPPSALKNPSSATANENPYGYKGANYASANPSDPSGASGFQRMSRMRSEFYSPQYNATYNQQNGCSITPNSGAAGYHSTSYWESEMDI